MIEYVSQVPVGIVRGDQVISKYFEVSESVYRKLIAMPISEADREIRQSCLDDEDTYYGFYLSTEDGRYCVVRKHWRRR